MTYLRPEADRETGSFVENLEGQTGTGFHEGTRVHKDWWAKTQSFEQVAQQIAEDATHNHDKVVKVSDIEPAVENGRLVVYVDGDSYNPTSHSVAQLSGRIGVPGTTVVNKIRNDVDADVEDNELCVAILQNYLRKSDPERQFQVRCNDNGTVRAFLSTDYTFINNSWFVEQLQEFLPSARVSHLRGNSDTITANLLLPDTLMDYGQDDDSDYGGMVSFGNCEVGTSRLSQYPSVFRSICMNGCIHGQTRGNVISQVHRGTIDYDQLKVAMAENINNQLQLMPGAIAAFLATRQQAFSNSVNAKQVVAATAVDYRFTKDQALSTLIAFNKHERDHRNLFGVVNAVTRAGQLFDFRTTQQMDMVGGNMVASAGRWMDVIKKAEAMTDSDMDKVYGKDWEAKELLEV